MGWSMQNHLRTELVTAALQMAIEQRKPQQGVIHHSDQGCQYTSIEFGSRCRKEGVLPSMGSVGDCYDNALCESFFATLKSELTDRFRFGLLAEAKAAVRYTPPVLAATGDARGSGCKIEHAAIRRRRSTS